LILSVMFPMLLLLAVWMPSVWPTALRQAVRCAAPVRTCMEVATREKATVPSCPSFVLT